MYRNMRWNVPLAFYMALRGIAVLGLVPMLVIHLVVGSDDLAVALMIVAVVLSAGIPFSRTLLGKVWVCGDTIYARNPFRTVRLPFSQIGQITTRALWQNFFIVAAVERAGHGHRGSTRLLAAPSFDIEALAEKLAAARQG